MRRDVRLAGESTKIFAMRSTTPPVPLLTPSRVPKWQTLTFRRQTTDAIAYDAPASTVKAALEALSSVGTVEVDSVDSSVLCSAALTDRDTNLRVQFTSEVRTHARVHGWRWRVHTALWFPHSSVTCLS